MTIRAKLKFAAFAPATMAIVIGIALLWSFRTLEVSRERNWTAQKIINSTNDLISLAQSYALHPEPRPRQQFLAVEQTTGALFDAIRLDRRVQRDLLENMRRNVEVTKDLFARLVASHGQSAPAGDVALLREAQDRLAGQVLIRARDVLADALELESLINDEGVSAQRTVNILVLVLLVATILPLSIAVIAMMKSIEASLAALNKGTAAVASGQTSHRIGISSSDELGQLARSFDRMTKRLEETTVSRDVLASEVQVRKRAEGALRTANDLLSEADRRKNEFLAVLSHELRNPLTPIRNCVYILKHTDPGSDRARNAQEVVERQIEQLARLVDDLLDVTRISRNKIHLQLQRLELNDLVKRTIEDQGTLFDNSGVLLEFYPAPAAIFVDADRSRLAQIVGNLLQNAAKFTDRGGVTRVWISQDPGRSQAVIRVEDTGAGMTPEIIARLFEPFTQADSTLDRSQGGLGLGLALVKGLVALHGGEIDAHSDGPGRGAEFIVRLPLSSAQSGGGEPPRRGPAARPTRVLVIEDIADTAETLRLALTIGGHEVAVAADGPDGLRRALEFRPEVVLCDIGLPGMNGYEVARAFRSDPIFQGIWLVALSGYALPEDLRQAADAGFDRHLAKPPSMEDLAEILEHAGRAERRLMERIP